MDISEIGGIQPINRGSPVYDALRSPINKDGKKRQPQDQHRQPQKREKGPTVPGLGENLDVEA